MFPLPISPTRGNAAPHHLQDIFDFGKGLFGAPDHDGQSSVDRLGLSAGDRGIEHEYPVLLKFGRYFPADDGTDRAHGQ